MSHLLYCYTDRNHLMATELHGLTIDDMHAEAMDYIDGLLANGDTAYWVDYFIYDYLPESPNCLEKGRVQFGGGNA